MFEKTIDITTECQNCVFYSDGCEAGRLQIFEARGIVGEKDGFPLIKGLCTLKRDKQWADGQKSTLLNAALKENKVKVALVIVDNSDEKRLKALVSSILEGDPPKEIYVVSDKDRDSVDRLHSVMTELVFSRNLQKVLTYSTVRVYDIGKSDSGKIDMCINKKTKSMFYAVLYSASEYSVDALTSFVRKIDDYVNLDVLKFMVIKPNADWPLVVNVTAHNTFDGNNGFPIEEKLEEIAKLQEKPEFIMEWI